MKKLIFMLIILLPLAVAAPGHCFFDWLFSGGASRDAIDNSALGDLRAWWTGNPGYVFNPWWSGPSNPQAQGSSGAYGPQAPYPQMPQPNISYSPPQGPPAGYGQPMQQPMPQAMQPGYGPGMAAGVNNIKCRRRAINLCLNTRLRRNIKPHRRRTTPSGVPSCTPDDATTRASAGLSGYGRRSANGPAR